MSHGTPFGERENVLTRDGHMVSIYTITQFIHQGENNHILILDIHYQNMTYVLVFKGTHATCLNLNLQ